MADFTWPTDGGREFYPEAFDESVEFDVELTVARSGRVSTRSLPGARWLLTMAFPETTVAYLAYRRRLEAFLMGLRGGADRLLLWNLLTPEPLGSMRGTATLAASVAAGDTTAQLTGGYAYPNLLRYGSFELDTNADGLADGWQLFVGGAGDGARTYTKSRVPTGTASHGTATQYILITGAGNANDSGITVSTRTAAAAATQYTLSAAIRASVSGKVYLTCRAYDSGGGSLGDFSTATVPTTGALAARSVSFTTPAGTATLEVAVRGITAVGEWFEVDAVQLEAAAATTTYAGFATLLRGDRISIAGRRVMLTADATGNDAGTATVYFQPPLNAAASSGAAVTLVRPTTRYVLTTPVVVMPVRGSKLPGFAIELVEE